MKVFQPDGIIQKPALLHKINVVIFALNCVVVKTVFFYKQFHSTSRYCTPTTSIEQQKAIKEKLISLRQQLGPNEEDSHIFGYDIISGMPNSLIEHIAKNVHLIRLLHT